MCGIFTAVNPEKKSLKILDFLDCIKHRGPDNFGWVNWEGGAPAFAKHDDDISGNVVQGPHKIVNYRSLRSWFSANVITVRKVLINLQW